MDVRQKKQTLNYGGHNAGRSYHPRVEERREMSDDENIEIQRKGPWSLGPTQSRADVLELGKGTP